VRIGKVIFILVIIALAGGIAYRVYRLVTEKKQRAAERPQEVAVMVRAIPVEEGTVRRDIRLTGDIEATTTVQVFPKAPGRLLEPGEKDLETIRGLYEDGVVSAKPPDAIVKVDKGDSVQKDQIIAVIDHENLDTQVLQAQAAVTTAEAQRTQAEVALAQMKKDLEKTRNLYQEGGTSRQALDKLETEHESLVQQKNVADARVKQNQAALDQARIQLAECFIRATISGILSEKYLEEGDMAMVTRPIYAIIDIDKVEVAADLSERYLGEVREGSVAAIEVDAFPGRAFEGIVTRISPTLNVVNRTAELEIGVPNPGHLLKPGMFARVALTVAKKEGVPVIPESAVLRRSEKDYVFVVENGVARRRDIELGLDEGPRVEVDSGLQTGDMLVVAGQQRIADGDTVQLEE
jgi:HlyD family secretion protein